MPSKALCLEDVSFISMGLMFTCLVVRELVAHTVL